jgi:hypothetical protein
MTARPLTADAPRDPRPDGPRSDRAALAARRRPASGAALHAARETRDLAQHGRSAVATRSVRAEAHAAAPRRQAGPPRADRGPALRVLEGHAVAARHALRVRAARPMRRAGLRAAAAPCSDRRQDRVREVDAHRAVQPRSRAGVHEHGPRGRRAAELRVVGALRPRQRRPRPAGLRRARVGQDRSGRRIVVVVERLPAFDARGRRAAHEGRAGAVSCAIPRVSTAKHARARSSS